MSAAGDRRTAGVSAPSCDLSLHRHVYGGSVGAPTQSALCCGGRDGCFSPDTQPITCPSGLSKNLSPEGKANPSASSWEDPHLPHQAAEPVAIAQVPPLAFESAGKSRRFSL